MTTETAANTTPDHQIGGPELPQERRVVTEIPGPRSRALQERRTAAVASGVGSVLPVYVAAAGGGVIVDVDGNSLIDLASGIAVVSVGNSAPKVVQAVQDQVAAYTHTCFMVAPYEGYVEVCEKLAELTPGDHAKKAALFNSGAEAVENAVKIARAHTGRDAVAVFDHAYHGRTNLTMAMTAKNMPYKHGFGPFAGEVYRAPMSYPFREPTEITGAAGGRSRDRRDREAGRRRQPGLRRDRAGARRGRLRGPRARASSRRSRTGAATTAWSSSPTRSSPACAAPAPGSPASTRASYPTW